VSECYPVPGLIERPGDPQEMQDKRWRFRTDHSPATWLSEREMAVPLGDDEDAHSIRIHEQLHVALSPLLKDADMALEAAEEARIETIATRAGIERDYGTPPGVLTRLLRDGQQEAAWAWAVSSIGAPGEAGDRQQLREYEQGISSRSFSVPRSVARQMLKFMDRAREILQQDTTFAASERIAEELRRFLPPGSKPGATACRVTTRTFAAPPPERTRPPRIRMPLSGERGHVIPVSCEEIAAVVPMYGSVLRPDWGPSIGDAHQWGVLRIEHPPLTRLVTGSGRHSRASDYGTVFRQPWRLTSDDKVFRTRRHIRQGTILVDKSASMSLTTEAVERIVRAAPAAVVAAYAGYRTYGSLRVLADNGRMAEEDDFALPGGNVVDGPAVEWLARQRTPRVLVTDGGFTYVDDEDIHLPCFNAFATSSTSYATAPGGPWKPGQALYGRLETARIQLVKSAETAERFLR
jgi:hypothetical protein